MEPLVVSCSPTNATFDGDALPANFSLCEANSGHLTSLLPPKHCLLSPVFVQRLWRYHWGLLTPRPTVAVLCWVQDVVVYGQICASLVTAIKEILRLVLVVVECRDCMAIGDASQLPSPTGTSSILLINYKLALLICNLVLITSD